jgi:hypothetical protein
MVLKGEAGAVQFLVYTNWQLPHVVAEQARKESDADLYRLLWQPMGADVGYHSPTARYEGQDRAQESCPYLDGAPCFYDGSGLAAETMLALLIAKGSDAVWEALQERYDQLFALAAVPGGSENAATQKFSGSAPNG